jgi:Fe-S oxidoreductase
MPPADAPVVILFPDCFTVYNEPEVGRAAVEVLETFGYRVVLPPAGCCGRAAISHGLLPQAVRMASRTTRDLERVIESSGASAVVGCEPSCVSAIVDDWPDLKLTVPLEVVERVALRTMMIEEFLEREWSRHPRHPEASPDDSNLVLLHGHCHQKALWGTSNVLSLLQRFGNENVRALDSGCCGMAGAFGFTRDHFDISLQIAELALFPALREHPAAAVVAPGTSCRHQIRDGLDRLSLHPVQFIADQLAGRSR